MDSNGLLSNFRPAAGCGELKRMLRRTMLLAPALLVKGAETNTYRIFSGAGRPATLDEVVEAASQAEVTFLGETHNDAVAHALQLEIFTRLQARRPVSLAMEMFERDVQTVVDEYLADLITEEQFLAASRPWKNYKTDYRPLVELAKSHGAPVVAANAPRRYVNRVSRMGAESLQSLGPEARSYLAPLPYRAASAAYAERFFAVMKNVPPPPGPPRNPQWGLEAQSLWDATMAHSVAEAHRRQPGRGIVHLNGSFHTEYRQGIVTHLEHYNPRMRSVVVTMHPKTDYATATLAKEQPDDFVIFTAAPAKG
jgi:uncharacterized iron-regulated protein